MEYNSFYGGRRGASFVIVQKYSSIAEMVSCFQQGGDYLVANYDEYVLIDTVNKNDKDNGKVYRRGYDYTNELGGAIYIGQIVGPAGMAPHVEMKTIAEVEELVDQDGLVDEEENEYRRTSGSYAPIENLVPGKYEEDGVIKYNDEIQYVACSVKDANSHESTVHFGFLFPYTVIDYTAESVSPYYNRDNETADFTNEELVVRTDDETHPYFEKWHISIPKGIKGETFNNFRVTTAAEVDSLDIKFSEEGDVPADYRATSETNKKQILVYDYYNYDKDGSGEPVSIYLGDYNMIENVSLNEDGTFTIDYTHDAQLKYNKLINWIKSINLNTEDGTFTVVSNNGNIDYNTTLDWVKNITINDEGTLTIDYTKSPDFVEKNKIKWINSVELNATQGDEKEGHLKVTFNTKSDGTNNDVFETDLAWVNNISMSDTGLITLHYSGEGKDVEVNSDNLIKWITEMSLDPDTALWTVKFNNGDPDFTQQLQWVKDLSIAADGTVTIYYADADKNTKVETKLIKWIDKAEYSNETGKFVITYNTSEVFETTLDYVKDIAVDEDGTITFDYTDSESKSLNQIIKWIKEVNLDTDTGHLIITYNTKDEQGKNTFYETDLKILKKINVNEETQKLEVTYSTGEVELIGEPLNYIMKTAVSSDYHLLILHSDPAKRQAIIDAGENYSYDGRNDWQDMGAIKDYDGLLIGMNISTIDVPTIGTKEGAVEYLNTTYPNGLTANGLNGKIVTVGETEDEKSFYAFDYNSKVWYYLGKVQFDVITNVTGKESDENTAILAEQMPTNGIWFIVE